MYKRIIVIIFVSLFLFCCSKKEAKKEEGIITFTADSIPYKFDSMQLRIKANRKMWDGKKVKTIKKGEKTKFYFEIRSGKYKGIKKKEDSFRVVWNVKSDDFMKIILSQIAYSNKEIDVSNLRFNVYVPQWWIKNPDGKKHNCWIKIDSIDSKRVVGRFGGAFELHSLENSELGKNSEIVDGKFDIPYKKFYKF